MLIKTFQQGDQQKYSLQLEMVLDRWAAFAVKFCVGADVEKI